MGSRQMESIDTWIMGVWYVMVLTPVFCNNQKKWWKQKKSWCNSHIIIDSGEDYYTYRTDTDRNSQLLAPFLVLLFNDHIQDFCCFLTENSSDSPHCSHCSWWPIAQCPLLRGIKCWIQYEYTAVVVTSTSTCKYLSWYKYLVGMHGMASPCRACAVQLYTNIISTV